MRLREIQEIIRNNISDLKLEVTSINTVPQQIQLTNILNANKSIENIKNINLFSAEINQLQLTSFYKNSFDIINVSNQEYSTIINLIEAIRLSSQKLLEALESALGDKQLSQNQTASIKFAKLKNFEDLLQILEKLKKVIQLPIAEYKEGGEIEIINFDSGSFWIDILLPTTSSVMVLGSIAWAGAVIFKKYQEAFAFKTYVKSLDIQVDYLETLKNAATKKIDLDIEAEAKIIQNQYFTPQDIEQLNRLKLSIKEYSKLIQKGVEIQPSITASEQISNLFPNYKILDLIESKMKHIEQ